MYSGSCYLNDSIDFSTMVYLRISSSEYYWLNRSLIAWYISGDCLKSYFKPLPLFFSIVSLYAIVLVTAVTISLSSTRVFLCPPVKGFYHEKLWLYSSLNLVACDLMRCLFAVPMVVYSHSTTNWWFGETMCTAHTSMQIMPFIVAEFTHLIIALDRYMSAKHSSWICRPKFSTFSVVAVWIFCAFTVLPLKGYVNYFDLNALFGESFHDQAICAVKTGKETREHNVAFFIALYLIPHATIVYFYSKTCDELRRQMAYEQIPQTVLRPPSRCLSPSSTDETEHASRRKKLNFRKASPDLQFALNVQLRNNAVIFGFCWLPVQMVYALAAAVSAQLFDVLTVCGFLITSLSPIIKSASILINRNVYWDFMAFDGRPPRPPRSVSEERLPHE